MNYLQNELNTALNAFNSSGAILGNYLSKLTKGDYEALEMWWKIDGEGEDSMLAYAEKVRTGRHII